MIRETDAANFICGLMEVLCGDIWVWTYSWRGRISFANLMTGEWFV